MRVKKHHEPTDWSLRPQTGSGEEKHYSSDELIDAYFRGKRDQAEENKKILMRAFSDNIKKAKTVCEEFFLALEQNGVGCEFVALRTKSISQFDAIFTVAKDKFISPDFDVVYQMALEKEKEITAKNTFSFYFSFMPLTESLNERQMLVDGYIMKYAKKE
ncbi:MAG: hypothetical protein LBI42_02345 [Chitinispirillales bacterium]|nr:hypothetical protein [Chitinispirillales bacterium]